MQISKALFQRMVQLWRDSLVALYSSPPDDKWFVAIVNQPFTPTPTLTLAGLSLQTTLLNQDSGMSFVDDGAFPAVCWDPVTGEMVATWYDYLGQGQFYTVGTGPAFTVHGFAFVNWENSQLLGSQRIDDPFAVTNTQQWIGRAFPEFRFPRDMVR